MSVAAPDFGRRQEGLPSTAARSAGRDDTEGSAPQRPPGTDVQADRAKRGHGGRRQRLVRRSWPLALCLALVWGAGEWAARHRSASLADGIQRSMDVHAIGLRGVTARFGHLPATLAEHPAVLAALAMPLDGAAAQRADRYLAAVNLRAEVEALYLMDMSGRTVASSNWDTPASYVGHSYGNRPYFIDAQGGRPGLFYGVGQTTGRPGLFLSAPVRQDGRVVGVVALKVSLQPLTAAWAHARDPIAVVDDRGIVVVSSVAEWTYRATRPLSAQDEAWLCLHRQYGPCGSVQPMQWQARPAAGKREMVVRAARQGRSQEWLALGEPLPELGWSLVVMADTAPVAHARYIAWALASLGAAAIFLAVLAWRLRERRMVDLRRTGVELERRVAARTLELQEAHAFRQAMEDSLVVGMCARDLEGRILYTNRAFDDLLGLSDGEVIGSRPPYRFWHPEEIERQWQLYDAALSGRAPVSGTEHRFRHARGHDVIATVHTAPLIDGRGVQTGWMSSLVDVTARKRAEELQRLQSEQLQHATRLASVGEMASTLAHELNQPLMAMSTFAGAARHFSVQGRSADLAECLDGIREQAQRARRIIDRVRELARRRSPAFTTVALNDVVGQVLVLMEPELRRHRVIVVTELDAACPAVQADQILLEQVLVNLLLNATQSLAAVERSRRQVEIRTHAGEGVVQLGVSDHGQGVAAAARERLFESFNTTRAQGLGLGLSICRTIAESHRGRIWHAPRDGGGAVFTLELPVSP